MNHFCCGASKEITPKISAKPEFLAYILIKK